MGKWLGHVGNRKFIIHRSEATPHHWNWSGYSKFWALLPQLLGWAMHGGPVGQSGNHRVNTASSPGLFPQLALAPSGVAGGFPWQRRHLAPPAAATASRGPETWRSGGWEGFKQQKLRLNWLNQTTCGFSNVWSKTNPRTPSEFAVNRLNVLCFRATSWISERGKLWPFISIRFTKSTEFSAASSWCTFIQYIVWQGITYVTRILLCIMYIIRSY